MTKEKSTDATRKHIKSLREYIDALKALGEIQEIDKEVDWNLEVGAITRRVCETGEPAPLFNKIKGIEKGFRVLGAPGVASRQEGLHLARVALSLGLDPSATGQEMIQALVEARSKKGIPPERVNTAPCKENIKLGKDVDLFQFPTPLIHDGDGGRYFGTLGMIVVQSPDKKWTNWSIARIMLTDKNKMTGMVNPLQHVGIIHKMWNDIGKPTPFAVVQGGEPFLPFVCGMPLPAFANECDYAGAYFGEPIEVVKCETSDLEVPASAEIVVEGFISNTEKAEEGPMGEYAGYLWPGTTSEPVYEVSAVTYRNQPILPVCAAGEPVEEDHTAYGIPRAAETLVQLREQGVPVTMVWSPLASANHWTVVTVPQNWRQQIKCSKEELCRKIGKIILESKAGVTMAKMLVINDDIDPTNLQELVWAFATRCHPDEGEIVLQHSIMSPLIAFSTKHEKFAYDGPKCVYNCLGPEDWGDELPIRSSFRFIYPPSLQEKVLNNWNAYGFAR